MPDPYVNWKPANIGACSATWYVGPEVWEEGDTGESPGFGPGFTAGPTRIVGAWDYLQPGPLKDSLLQPITDNADIMQKWAAAGGSIEIVAAGGTDAQAPIFGAAAHPFIFAGNAKFLGFIIQYNAAIQSGGPVAPPRWQVRFSVPHSIVR